jgi:hypothetical protein
MGGSKADVLTRMSKTQQKQNKMFNCAINSYLHYKLRKFTFMCEVFLNGRGEA